MTPKETFQVPQYLATWKRTTTLLAFRLFNHGGNETMKDIRINSLESSERPLRRIGAGHCGSVWANPDLSSTDVVIKREDGGPGRSLANDFNIHTEILTSLQSCRALGQALRINFPSGPQWISSKDESTWQSLLPTLPVGYTACNALVSERIPPMPLTTRQVLVEKYCPESIRAEILADEKNDDCIIRPYLGRRRRAINTARPRFEAFSLRNYPLHADQMEELGLDLILYAEAMAEALAFMHWSVGIDANDVEFVLAPDRCVNHGTDDQAAYLPSTSSTTCDGMLDEHCIWVLDFDCCRRISMDEKGVDMAVAAFYRNDPFYPKPHQPGGDELSWGAFFARYLEFSGKLLDGRGPGIEQLPRDFIMQLILRADEFKQGRQTLRSK